MLASSFLNPHSVQWIVVGYEASKGCLVAA
jgi:hypothetical protein